MPKDVLTIKFIVGSNSSNNSVRKSNSKDRVKLTTMINPKLRDKLKRIAIKRESNFSDVLEEAIRDYLK